MQAKYSTKDTFTALSMGHFPANLGILSGPLCLTLQVGIAFANIFYEHCLQRASDIVLMWGWNGSI